MKINVLVEIDTDELFAAANKFDDVDRKKFNALILTEEFHSAMAIQMLDDFYVLQALAACSLEEGIFAAAVYDEDEDESNQSSVSYNI